MERVLEHTFVGVVVLVLFGGGAFMLVLWFFADADSSAEGRSIALLMGVAFLGMAVLLVYGWRRSSTDSTSAVAERVGVPDSVQRAEDAHPKTNIPNALRGQNPPRGAVIVAGRSIWSSRVLLTVALTIGVGLLYLGWNLERIFPEWHVSAGYLFMGFGALLLILGLWPGNWRKRTLGFIAMQEGIYAHGQGSYPDGHEWATPETRWLFVPWTNVVDVREGLVLKVAGGPPGGAWWPSTKLSLRVTPDEAREWFPYADDEPSDDGMSRIVSLDYSDSDPSPKETVPRLQQLWAPSRV
ncbi:hypothetical protein QWY84_07835 [Aquisalimonas lutea]|uniref:hypothetical protein n=1 Tax=Aquisalimonas lutea TaxID=1327750 RepID=UPI0025B3A535|nr:hypothetical protein [Aquisalimonas lutea]MDN3517514.1 hypothetical protein [Aquisalimonas lutea]